MADHDGTRRVTDITERWWLYDKVAHLLNIYGDQDSKYRTYNGIAYEMTACGKEVEIRWVGASPRDTKCEDCKLVQTMWELAK